MLVNALLALACCYLPGGSGASGSSGGGSGASGAGTSSAARTPALDRLEAHLATGAVWGASPADIELAHRVHEGPLRREDGVAVETLARAGRQRTIVLVEIYDDGRRGLADLDDGERRGMLTRIGEYVRPNTEAEREMCIAIRGTVFYGALLAERPGVAPVYEVGFSVDEQHIETCLTAP